jgi:3-hydroxyacyl-CoA dehydrogenase
MDKVCVVAGNCKGFIGNRMLHTYVREARMLLLEGAFPHQVDSALQGFGFAMGPFRMYDVVGIDLEWRARELAGKGQDDPAVQVDNRLCGLGRFGQKSRLGYYRYAEGSRQAEHDPEVDALVLQVSEQLGFARRDIGPEEILERCLLALINVDTVYLNGYGFPADTGGPMAWADSQGLPAIRARLEALAERFGSHWQPAALIRRLAESGRPFADFQQEA